MKVEVITRRRDLLIRRLVLETGEAMFWHVDRCHRFSVVVRGDRLAIEFRDGGDRHETAVHAGMADWDAPESRVHRAVNVGSQTYEEIVTFYLEAPGVEPQPIHA